MQSAVSPLVPDVYVPYGPAWEAVWACRHQTCGDFSTRTLSASRRNHANSIRRNDMPSDNIIAVSCVLARTGMKEPSCRR
jgi:hypothetical protein